MLPKPQRLNLKKEFQNVSRGKRTETASMKLMFKTGDQKQPLVGISMSKKVFHKAHDRNKAKRKASDAVQRIYIRLRKDLNLVIMPKPGISTKNPDELVEELKSVKDLYSAD
jgi:ribonuclease P protein component